MDHIFISCFHGKSRCQSRHRTEHQHTDHGIGAVVLFNPEDHIVYPQAPLLPVKEALPARQPLENKGNQSAKEKVYSGNHQNHCRCHITQNHLPALLHRKIKPASKDDHPKHRPDKQKTGLLPYILILPCSREHVKYTAPYNIHISLCHKEQINPKISSRCDQYRGKYKLETNLHCQI